ncbi:MAG: methylated-DNA--[protein]-cysteine S-methyltransferase [Rikenellaceae bacterium]
MERSLAIYSSAVGAILVEHSEDNRLTRLQILDVMPSDLGHATPFADAVFRQVEEYLCGRRRHFDIDLDLSGCTPFQRVVLVELQRIPYGQTRSYKDVATAIGNPKASRAVGAANHKNPIHIIIPCHRVIGSGGALTGYAAGVDTKESLLELERGDVKR